MEHDKRRPPRTRSYGLLTQASTVVGSYWNVPTHRFEDVVRRENPSADCVTTKLDSFPPRKRR